MHEHDFWHESLEPPAGGLSRLITAVEKQRPLRGRTHWRSFATVSGAFAVLLAFGVLHYLRTAPQRSIHAAIQAALRAPADNRIRVENGAALELPSSDPNVRVFLVASLPVNSAERATQQEFGR